MSAFNSQLHPRAPKGTATGGQFAVAKGSSPAPSKKPAKNGSRYSKKQFAELQSLQKQHAKGKKLTKKQAHALHVAHELHLAHLRHEGKAKAVKVKGGVKRRSAPKVRKTGRSSIGHRR